MAEPELTPAEQALQEQLLGEFMSDQLFPAPHHFAARAEIRRLQARINELEGAAKPARAKRAEAPKEE